jgi:hypothetical protein
MRSIHRSILTRALMTGVASLAFVMVSAAGARAEIVTVQGDDGAAGADGVFSGDPGLPGGDGESVSVNAGSAQPITAPLNKATATGGNGGQGGNGNNGNGARAATAALRTPRHRLPSSPVRRNQTPILPGETAGEAGTASFFSRAVAARAVVQPRLAPRRRAAGGT